MVFIDQRFLSPSDGLPQSGVSNRMHEELAETASVFHADASWQRPFVRSGDVTEALKPDQHIRPLVAGSSKKGRYLHGA